jgi:F-type H+-transporting ATPase subunit a
VNLLRPILAVAVIAFAIVFSGRYAEHHTSEDVFQQLYLHLMPARLVQHAEGEHDTSGEHADGEHEHEAEAAADHGGDGHEAAASLIALPLPAALGAFGAETEHGFELAMTNLQVFQIASVLLIFILLGGIGTYLRTGKGDYLTRLFTGFAMYIRDDMVVPVMGKETTKKYLPYFLSIFFFILFMNLMGLVPGSATATASIFITGALAATTLFSIVFCGMIVQGPIAFWKNLVPHVPAALWPLMFVVELVGLFVKPFALMIRLFANMTGGHMVVLSFMGLIFFFASSMGDAAGWASSPVAVAFAGFIMIIEAFVALLQAYIFTQLTIIFVNMAIHPEH